MLAHVLPSINNKEVAGGKTRRLLSVFTEAISYMPAEMRMPMTIP